MHRVECAVRLRSTHFIASLPKTERLPAIAEGLRLVAEHSLGMEKAAASQTGPFSERAAAAIRAISNEEAGKFLILLDAARSTLGDQPALAKQLMRCSDHLAKGIYERMVTLRPATFGELVGYIDDLRASHYLDGPNDVDWIFANQIDTEREGRLYVDYVKTDEGPEMWLTPGRYDTIERDFGPSTPSSSVRLVEALHAAGADRLEGLLQIAEVWDGYRPEVRTHWQENAKRNVETLHRLQALEDVELEPQQEQLLVETWTFPLAYLDLSRKPVKLEELRARRQRVLDRLNAEIQREMYGEYEDEMRSEYAAEYAEYEAEMRAEYAEYERSNLPDERGY